MNGKIKQQKKKYLPIEIDIRVVDDADVITTSAPVTSSEHDNDFGDFGDFE